MAKVDTFGHQENTTKASGCKETKKDMASGRALREIPISGNGFKTSHMDSESTYGAIMMSMRESGKHA